MQARYNLYTFRDYAILTVRNNTVTEINKAVFMQLHSPPSIFHFTDFVEQNRREENNIKLLPVELLQTFNFNSLPPLKLSLKVGAPVIFL